MCNILKSKNQELQNFVLLMHIVCSVNELGCKVILSLKNKDNDEICRCDCEQNFFCEKITEMFLVLQNEYKMRINQNQALEKDTLSFKVDFEEKKHITTARIFKSFVLGLAL